MPAAATAQRLEPAPARGGGGAGPRTASLGPFLGAGDSAASRHRWWRAQPGSLTLLSCLVSNPGLPCPLPLPSVGMATMDCQMLLFHFVPLQPGFTAPFPALPFHIPHLPYHQTYFCQKHIHFPVSNSSGKYITNKYITQHIARPSSSLLLMKFS